LPNSHRQIEPELMRRLTNDIKIGSIISSGVRTKGLELLRSRSTVGSLSATDDQFSSDETERFWYNSINIRESLATGSESFPGEMQQPSFEGVLLSESKLDLMVAFYTDTYAYNFRKPADDILQGSITVRVKMDQFGRCRIGSEVFGSTMSMRHVKSSYVMANFITNNGEVDCYPGQVQYYFKHVVDFPNGPAEHSLAYIRWYKPAETAKIRFYFSNDDDENCNVELWKPDFYHESRDCIIPVHNILCRFVPVKYKISRRNNAIEYLAINQINRKFHIR
jgi:hypothetical protein